MIPNIKIQRKKGETAPLGDGRLRSCFVIVGLSHFSGSGLMKPVPAEIAFRKIRRPLVFSRLVPYSMLHGNAANRPPEGQTAGNSADDRTDPRAYPRTCGEAPRKPQGRKGGRNCRAIVKSGGGKSVIQHSGDLTINYLLSEAGLTPQTARNSNSLSSRPPPALAGKIPHR
jgi:hypothetical protein